MFAFSNKTKVLILNNVKQPEGKRRKIKTIVRHPVLKPVRNVGPFLCSQTSMDACLIL